MSFLGRIENLIFKLRAFTAFVKKQDRVMLVDREMEISYGLRLFIQEELVSSLRFNPSH